LVLKSTFYWLTIFIAFALGTLIARANPAADNWTIAVTVVTGELSKDSNSTTVTLWVSGDKLTYHRSYHGAHPGNRKPLKEEFILTAADRANLLKLLREKNLLVTKTLSSLTQQQRPGSYFSLSIRSTVEGKEHTVTINLPRHAAKSKEDRLYQDSVALCEELYRIMRRTDPSLSMPELIY
jgi:hypothetical protein